MLLLFPIAAVAERPNLLFRLGIDSFVYDQSDIAGVSGMSIFVVNDHGFYFGESIYSAAIGSGGGFFVGGFEVGKYQPVGNDFFIDASLFVGGGGGASQVPGDGLMLRPQIQAGYDFGAFRLGAGVAWVSVSGSEISTPAFSLSLTRPLNMALVSGNTVQDERFGDLTRVSTMKPGVRYYFPVNNLKKGGAELSPMLLLGAEITFAKHRFSETFIRASGVASGDAEGYADWILGQRYFWGNGHFRGFANFGAGVGGGGAVDTGGGLIVMAGAGLRLDISNRFGVEIGVDAISSVNGDFFVVSPSVNGSLSFGRGAVDPETSTQTHWQISTGFTQQFPNAAFRKPGVVNEGAPLMIDTEIDLFLSDALYLTGHAYTALAGGAGGYQIGLVGLGYRVSLAQRWSASIEALVGVGGGAGVDTRGGLLAGYRVDVDYHLSDATYLSFGAGQIMTIAGGGMRPATVNIGLKFPFTTLH